jgi:hypothetical protein
MPSYKAPLEDMKFVLNTVLNIQGYAALPGFADAPADMVDAILDGAAQLAEDVLAPLNLSGDQAGCVRHADGSVSPPDGFKAAYQQVVEGGWTALSADPNYGGQRLPHVLALAFNEMVSAANMSFAMYPGLTHGAYSAILHHGSDAQKALYLPKLVSGEWTGTMNLTEPHCGTDLGLLRTKAVPNADGSYAISGTKIFISAGEHDMAENIIHLVLARVEGDPAGTKGISLFIVPKFLVANDGTMGAKNGVSCGSLEHKMGIHANATCVMNYDAATGYLIGTQGKGLNAMFTMMNEARLGVAMQGLAQAEVAYQNALAYAKDRLQGRALTGPKNPDGPADPIIVHPDVRRMLMDAKAFIEGARAFLFWVTLQQDLLDKSPDEAVRQKADDYMGLMTPVLKGVLTDRGFQTCVDMQQVFGGHGFIEEWGMSQFVRDARIAMIYEGANGVQALDLVGRKLGLNGGRAIMTFFAELDAFIAAEGSDEMKPYVDGLTAAKNQLQAASLWLMQNGMSNFDNAGAASTDYMHLFGITALAYMWALSAKAALGDPANPQHAAKLKTARYYMARIVPEAALHRKKLETGADVVMALEVGEF